MPTPVLLLKVAVILEHWRIVATNAGGVVDSGLMFKVISSVNVCSMLVPLS
jgi:hypothetical protein